MKSPSVPPSPPLSPSPSASLVDPRLQVIVAEEGGGRPSPPPVRRTSTALSVPAPVATPEGPTTMWGTFVRTMKATSFWGKALLLQITIETLILVVMEAVIMAKTGGSGGEGTGTDPVVVYGILLVILLFFALCFAWDAVLNENSIQLCAFTLFSILLAVYGIARAGDESEVPLHVAVAVIVAVGEIPLLFFVYKVYGIFGWRVYLKIGADPRVRRMYRVYLVMQTLIKLDFSIAISLLAQNLSLALDKTEAEFYLNILGFLFVIFYTAVLMIGVRYENVILMYLFFFLSLFEPVYTVFKVVTYTNKNSEQYIENNYADLPHWQIVASAATGIVVRILLVMVAFQCFQNFDKQLKQHLDRTNRASDVVDTPTSNISSFASRKMTME